VASDLFILISGKLNKKESEKNINNQIKELQKKLVIMPLKWLVGIQNLWSMLLKN